MLIHIFIYTGWPNRCILWNDWCRGLPKKFNTNFNIKSWKI